VEMGKFFVDPVTSYHCSPCVISCRKTTLLSLSPSSSDVFLKHNLIVSSRTANPVAVAAARASPSPGLLDPRPLAFPNKSGLVPAISGIA
jgi:hypothetical protein